MYEKSYTFPILNDNICTVFRTKSAPSRRSLRSAGSTSGGRRPRTAIDVSMKQRWNVHHVSLFLSFFLFNNFPEGTLQPHLLAIAKDLYSKPGFKLKAGTMAIFSKL